MQQEQYDNNILSDKALANTLFGKDTLGAFDAKQKEVPFNYFEDFESTMAKAVGKKNKLAPIFSISKFGKIAIAASLLTIATTAYLFISPNHKTEEIAINVDIKDIPTVEIDEYVNSNEIVAEIDWQDEINAESSTLDNVNAHLIKDSNNLQ